MRVVEHEDRHVVDEDRHGVYEGRHVVMIALGDSSGKALSALVTLGDSWVVPIMPGTSSSTGTTGGYPPMATPNLQYVVDGELYLGAYFPDVPTVSHTTSVHAVRSPSPVGAFFLHRFG